MKKLVPALVAAAFALAVSAPAWSGETDHPMVSYREAIMEALGSHMSASAKIVKGQVDRKQDIVAHAQALHDMSLMIPTLFPEDTAPSKVKSESKPEVWTKWDDFVKANKVLETETAKLLELAKAGDFEGYKAQFGKVGGACGDCHDTFRVDD